MTVFMKIVKYSTTCYQQNLTPTGIMVERLENRRNGGFKNIKYLIQFKNCLNLCGFGTGPKPGFRVGLS